MPPLRRARILALSPELLEQHRARDGGHHQRGARQSKVFPDAMGSVQRGIEVIKFAIGAPHLLKGGAHARHGQRHGRSLAPAATWRLRRHHPVQLSRHRLRCWRYPSRSACGNTLVLKPSEKDPSAAVMMAQLLEQAGLPDGVLNVVHGDKVAVDAILQHPLVEGRVVRRLDAHCEVRVCGRRRGWQTRAGARRCEEPRCRDARAPTWRSPPTRSSVPAYGIGRGALHGDFSRGRSVGDAAGSAPWARLAGRRRRRSKSVQGAAERNGHGTARHAQLIETRSAGYSRCGHQQRAPRSWSMAAGW